MFGAIDKVTRVRYAIPGADPASTAGAVPIDLGTAALLAQQRRLRCTDPHCDAPVGYVYGGSRARDHLRHPPGRGEECAASHAEMSAWHLWCQYTLFAGAEHERPTPDGAARCDALVRRKTKEVFTAIEFQHSHIRPETVRRRMDAHDAAGWGSTVWIVDATDLLPPGTLTGWADPTVAHPGTSTVRGVTQSLEIRRGWVIDVIETCRVHAEETGHRSTVGLLVRMPEDLLAGASGGQHVLRLIERASAVEMDGRRVAVIHGTTPPVSESAMVEWAKGADRSPAPRGSDLAAQLRILDGSPVRLVHPVRVWFDAAEHAGRVRIGFTDFHHDNRADGEGAGLRWIPGCNPRCGGGHVGHLVGSLTDPAVVRFVRGRFGYSSAA